MSTEIKSWFDGRVLWVVKADTLQKADLQRVDLQRADLRGVGLRGANLIDSNLRGADLRHVNLSGANLRGANLRDSNLFDADLRDSNLIDADLRDSNLCCADLRGADLDYSAWPLECKSFNAKTCARIPAQLAYHLCRLNCDDPDFLVARKALTPLAKRFHRFEECGGATWEKGE